MMAAIKSRPECKASESTPKLPVLTTRKPFRETRSKAEPTLKSAARFFSRTSIGATISISGLDYLRCCVFPGLQGKLAKWKQLFGCSHRWWWQEREPLGLRPFAAHFHLFEEERRRHDRGRQAHLCRSKSAKRCACEAVRLALHIVVNKIVAADPGDVPQGARVHADDTRSPNHFLAPAIGINAIDHQRQPVPGACAAAETSQQFRKFVLVEQVQRRIVHLSHDQAILAFGLLFRAAGVQKFLLQI